MSNNGTNNVDDEEKVFAELGRVARRGAQMVLTMNLPDTMKEFYDTFEEVLADRGMSAEIERLTEMLRESGAIERVHGRAQYHAVEAIGELARFDDGPARQALKSLPDLLLFRDR